MNPGSNARWIALSVVMVAALIAGGCSTDSDDSSEGDETPSESGEGTSTSSTGGDIEILVTNDDGVGAPGIDALVQALNDLEGVTVTVVAPAENQSGTSDMTTGGSLAHGDSETASGYPAVAVEGFPADSVIVALDELGIMPDIVISGINEGQNIGPLAEISGTVGAAKTAARAGYPALATSQGVVQDDTVEADFATGVQFTIDWFEENRELIASGEAPAEVVSINIPTCEVGAVRGLVDVPLSTDATGDELTTVDCESTLENPDDDASGFANGFVVLTPIPL